MAIFVPNKILPEKNIGRTLRNNAFGVMHRQTNPKVSSGIVFTTPNILLEIDRMLVDSGIHPKSAYKIPTSSNANILRD
jgi:hypothetical protein